MPTSTYDLIASNVLTSSASSVTFSSIPATYRDLVLVVNPINTVGGAQPLVRFNGDTGTNYHRVVMGGDGSGTGSASNSLDRMILGYYAQMDSTAGSIFILQIMDYSATDKHKTSLSRSNRASSGVDAHAIRWASTSAINEILVYSSANNYASGSTFYLYGIVS